MKSIFSFCLFVALFFCQNLAEVFAQQIFVTPQGEKVDFSAAKITSPFSTRLKGDLIFLTNFGEAVEAVATRRAEDWEQFYAVGYPKYLEADIVSHRTPFGTCSLRFPVLRGGVAIFSPRTEISQGLTYVGYAQVFSKDLKNDRVFASISLLNRDGSILKTTISEVVINTDDWSPLATEPLVADVPNAHSIALGLHLVPSNRQDLSGFVEFGLAAIQEQPTIQFQTDRKWQIYNKPEEVVIRGNVKAANFGWNGGARLELRNGYGEILDTHPINENTLDRRPSGIFDAVATPFPQDSQEQPPKFPIPPKFNDSENSDAEKLPKVKNYEFHWTPKITSSGFYNVNLTLPRSQSDLIMTPQQKSGNLSFVFLEPYGTLPRGDFGWSLPEKTAIDECLEMESLLAAVGISRLKIPVWLAEQSPEQQWQKYMKFCEWLNDHHIEPVGMMTSPPDELVAAWKKKRSQQSAAATVPASAQIPPRVSANTPPPIQETIIPELAERDFAKTGDIFSLPSAMWLPSVETTIFRLGMVIPNWQLGREHDLSLTDFSDLNPMLEQIQTRLDQQGLDASIGIVWNWIYPFPQAILQKKTSAENSQNENSQNNQDELQTNSRGFLSLENPLSLTADDLEYYLDATNDAKIKRFVSLQPLDRRRYATDGRIIDLIGQMIAAKEHGADAVFISQPFDANIGLFNAQLGAPDELFLPWRTTSLMISGKEPMGSINLPNQSENHLFRGESGIVMIVRNDMPTNESLILGKETRVTDVWGKEMKLPVNRSQQTISVGTVPVFVTNIQPDIAMMRQYCFFETSNIPSRYDIVLPNKLYFTNTSGDTIAGRLKFRPPQGITIKPPEIFLNLAPGETLTENLSIRLTPSAISGKQMIQIDVTTNLNDARFFTAYQPINVGGDDISIDLSTRLNRNNELEVYQTFINEGEFPVSFSCTLYAPSRPMQNMKVKSQGFGRSDYIYTLSNGSALIDQPLRLTAREINGKRVLKYELKGKP